MTRTTGTDHIDLQECRRRGIVVVRTPGVSSDAVSEQAMALVRDAPGGESERGSQSDYDNSTLQPGGV